MHTRGKRHPPTRHDAVYGAHTYFLGLVTLGDDGGACGVGGAVRCQAVLGGDGWRCNGSFGRFGLDFFWSCCGGCCVSSSSSSSDFVELCDRSKFNSLAVDSSDDSVDCCSTGVSSIADFAESTNFPAIAEFAEINGLVEFADSNKLLAFAAINELVEFAAINGLADFAEIIPLGSIASSLSSSLLTSSGSNGGCSAEKNQLFFSGLFRVTSCC